MNNLTFIFLVLILAQTTVVLGNDKGSNSAKDYEVIIKDYLEKEKNMESLVFPPLNQIVIYDSAGNITRQIEIEEAIDLATPAILKPVINKAEFLTEINGVYYYICDKIQSTN